MNENKKTRKELETNFKKKVLLDAAIKIFAANGFQKTSVEMIASKTGYAVGTIYNYFKSKEEFYEEAVNYIGNLFFESLNASIGEIEDPYEKLKYFVFFKLEFGDKNFDFIKFIITEDSAFEWNLKKELRLSNKNKIYESIIEIETSMIKDCQKAGKLKKVDSALITALLDSIIDGYFFYWLRSEKKEPLAKGTEKIFEFFMKGFGTGR